MCFKEVEEGTTSLIEYRDFESVWSEHLWEGHDPLECNLPVPLEIPGSLTLSLMVSLSPLPYGEIPESDPVFRWQSRVPVLYRRADQLTKDDRQCVAAFFKARIEFHHESTGALESLLTELGSTLA